MKRLITFSLLILFLFTSCEVNNVRNLDADLLAGQWRLNYLTMNRIDSNEINDWIGTSAFLTIGENKMFSRNYLYGSWQLDGNLLTLNPLFFGEKRVYNVFNVSASTLIMEIQSTEGEYCCDFEQFETHEILTFRETYKRVVD